MHEDLRKAIGEGAEAVARIEDIVAAMGFVINDRLINNTMESEDRFFLKALGGVYDTLIDLTANAAGKLERIHKIAAAKES